MQLGLWELELSGIGRVTSKRDAMWGKLDIRFRDSDTERYHGVEITLFLPRRPDVTIAEFQTVARDQSKTILQAALSYLEEHDLEELENISVEARKSRLAGDED
jgi:hypothetical protein